MELQSQTQPQSYLNYCSEGLRGFSHKTTANLLPSKAFSRTALSAKSFSPPLHWSQSGKFLSTYQIQMRVEIIISDLILKFSYLIPLKINQDQIFKVIQHAAWFLPKLFQTSFASIEIHSLKLSCCSLSWYQPLDPSSSSQAPSWQPQCWTSGIECQTGGRSWEMKDLQPEHL